MANVTTISNGDALDASPVNSNFQELATNIDNSNIAAGANIASSKLDLTNIASDISFDNTVAIEFQNSSGSDDARIFQDSSNDLEIHLNTAGQAAVFTDSTDADFFSIDTSNATINAWKGNKLQVWDSGSSDYIQAKHDGTNATILTGGTGGGDLILDPAGNNVLPGSDSTDSLGSASVRWANGYFDAADVSGTITGGTLTDGTASLTSGALSSATTGSFSGAVSVGSLSSSGSVSGTAATFTGLTHVNGNFLRITNNSDVLDIDCDGTDAIYNGSAGISVHKFNKAVSGNGAYINHSDKKLKKNIKEDGTGLAEIMQLKPKSFERKGDANNGKELGFVAQDVEAVLPDIVHTHGDGIKGIATDNLIPVMVNAIKELNAKVDALA